jgi:hypothetical protein
VEEGKRPHKKGEGIDEILQVSIGKELDRALAKRLEQAVQLRAVEVVAHGFEHGIAVLDAFISEEGHADVPVQIVYHGFALGKWISHQRDLRRLNLLTKTRVLALETRAVIWNASDQAWSDAVALYKEHVRKNGKDAVPTQGGKFNLFNWVRGQRAAYAKGQLFGERVAELEQIGITWSPKNSAWDEKLASLNAFIYNNKHTRVPRDFVDKNGVKLGAWVSDMRKRKKLNNKFGLSRMQISELEAVGFTWDALDHRWSDGIRHLLEYKKLFGNADVPGRYVSPDGYRLGSWVWNKRRDRIVGRLDRGQISQLLELGFVWTPGIGARKTRSQGKR